MSTKRGFVYEMLIFQTFRAMRIYKKKQMKACLKMITNFLDIYNGKYYNSVSNNY